MEEKLSCKVFGTRTSPIQYEKSEFTRNNKKKESYSQVYTTVRQGNKKYSVSPIYTKIVEK